MIDQRIETFLCVCKYMNYTKASQELHITQPAVSQHIRFLEERYDVRLFTYRDRKLSLTKAGKILYETMTVIRNDEEIMIKSMHASTPVIHLTFGVTLTAGEYTLPDILSQFLQCHPEINLHIVYGNAKQLLSRLEKGEIHFALIEGYYPFKKYEQLHFYTDSFVCLCSSNHVFHHKTEHVKDLLEERLLLRESGCGTRDLLDSYLNTYNLSYTDFQNYVEIENVSSIISLLKKDTGIAFSYRLAAKEELENGTLKEIPIQNLPLHQHTTFVWNKNSAYSERYRKICTELASYFTIL